MLLFPATQSLPKVYPQSGYRVSVSGVRVVYVVALATFDLATARAGASRSVGKRRR